MKVLTAGQMREVDRLTTERYGIPSIELMEAAASRTVEAAEREFGRLSGKSALVICGRGNNGGDGAAIARLIHARGALVDLLLLGRVEETGGDARVNLERARELAGRPGSAFRLVEITDASNLIDEAARRESDIVFDAILGTGLTRAASGLFEEAIRLINAKSSHSHVVSVDLPSGLDSDSSELPGPAVRAGLTVTFTAPKIANVLPPACEWSGKLVVAPIGSPGELVESAASQLNLVERAMVERWLTGSVRSAHAHKGDVGKVLIVAGSRGKTGAACLAGEAAMRAGAGLVTIATAESSQPVVASRVTVECMTESLPETGSGTVAREAVLRILELARERDVVAIGPGLGAHEESTRSMVREVVTGRQRAMILDADALNALAPWSADLGGRAKPPLILAPHPGEMSRLLGRLIAEVLRDRVRIARDFATSRELILVLKGSRTLIAAPDCQVYVNPTGNAGMASGGTGDVLTGMIAGLLAQKRDDPLGATIAAVYLHGVAGDIAASRIGIRAMIASDISACLGEAFVEVGGDSERVTR